MKPHECTDFPTIIGQLQLGKALLVAGEWCNV